MLTETAQQYALDVVAAADLTDTLAAGIAAVRRAIESGLASDSRLEETGIAVIGTRVVAVRPEPEVEKSLRTPTRERMQQESDKATFERRALAVERERAIGENEMQTRIELARREQELVTQRGANARREAEEAAAAGGIANEAEAQRTQRLAEANAAATRVTGAAEGEAETARLAAYRDVPESVLLGLAARDLAANLPKIDSLVLTPDLLKPLLAKLGTNRQVEAKK
jgi:hypothetical protein